MFRLLLVAVCLSPWPVLAAPAPKARAAAGPYLMARVGDTAVSEIRGDGVVRELTEVVTKVERDGDAIRVPFTQTLSTGRPVDLAFEASPKGVSLVAYEGKAVAAPVAYLRLPAKPGDSWSWESGPPGVAPAKHVRTIAGEEDLEVPAGKFRAVRVERETEGQQCVWAHLGTSHL